MAITNSCTFITGKSGNGKSYLAGALAEVSLKPRVILDPKDEYPGLAATRLVVTEEMFAKMEDVGHRQAWAAMLAKNPSVRIKTDGLDDVQMLEMADGLARAVRAKGNTLFVADEYYLYAPNVRCPSGIKSLHLDARTHGIDMICITQRAAEMATTPISQANRRITFSMDDVNDIARIAPYFSNPDPRRFKSAADAIRALPPRTCLYLNCDSGEQVTLDTNTVKRRLDHRG